MQRLKQQILELLDEDKKVLHKIYARWVEDHAYLWQEFEDLERLRELLLVIIKLFYHEHRQLQDVNKVDYGEFRKDVRELLFNHNALLQKARKAQVEEIEFFGLERWFEIFRKDIDKLNEIIERYEQKIEEAHVIDGGVVKMCAHYLNNGTLKEKYFALKTAINLNCMILTSIDHIADPRLVRQREMLIPAIADIVKIPEADLREPKAIIKIIPEIRFYFKFEDLKAGRGYSRN